MAIVFLLALAFLAFLPLALWAYSTLSAYLGTTFNFGVAGAQTSTSLAFPPAGAGNTLAFKTAYTLGSAAGEAQIVASLIQAITASSSVTIDLITLTDVLGLSVTAMTKLKAWQFVLLNAVLDTVNGNACSSVVIEGGASNPNTLSLGGTTPTYTLNNGAQWGHGDPGSAGVTVSSGACNVKLANQDSSNAAAMLIGLLGA
jgi:hypothetical protein